MSDSGWQEPDFIARSFSWGDLHEVGKPFIMVILNITPDSFSYGGCFISPEQATLQAKKMIGEGAAILDLGAESSRPGSQPISTDEELARLRAPLAAITAACPTTTVSVDSYKAAVADVVLAQGVSIINDIWGLQKDPHMAATIARHQAGVVIMHNQSNTDYAGDLIEGIGRFFEKSLSIALDAGINPQKIILDPGIGFGKTTMQNLEAIARAGELKSLGYPLLLGTSRKSVIGNTLNVPVEDRLEGTLATSVYGLVNGVSILRVHDVRANRLAAEMTLAIHKQRHVGR